VIAEASNDSASAAAATNGTSNAKAGGGKYRREISKKVDGV